MTQFAISPDRTVNNKKVHDLFRAVSSFHTSLYDVLRGRSVAGAFWWDIMLRHDDIRFYCTVPEDWKKEIRLHLENVWPLSAIEQKVIFQTEIPAASDACEMKYRRNNIFALQTDRRLEHEPLQSILSITQEMKQGDVARISIMAEPISRLDWQDWAEKQHKEFRSGRTPKRLRLTKKDVFVGVGETITGLLQSATDTLHLAIGGEETKPERVDDLEKRMLLLDGSLSRGTLNKLKTPTFNTCIRIASHSPDPERQKIILRSLANSFHDLTGDNELERVDIHEKIKPYIIRELITYRMSHLTRMDWDKNKMSNEELGRLVELPSAYLQDLYKDKIYALDSRQIEIPAALTKGGLYLGDVAYKKQTMRIYMPITNHDDLCYSSVIIAKKGQGKTKGFTCNRAVEFVKQGYSSIIIDAADSEAWEVIEKALPPDQRQRFKLGEFPISLDFTEIKYSPEARSRLAEVMMSFFEDNTDTAGAQTQRFLKAAVMGMQTGKLFEIVKIFKDESYRNKVIQLMPNGTAEMENYHKFTLQEFGGYKEDRQRQILAPILNRLDIILSSSYLTKCMSSTNTLDMLQILKKKSMCTVFDISDELNSRPAKDILVNLISLKLDIATPFRKKAERFPVAVFYDEPHQYLRSAKLWKNFVAEARKYRLAYHFMFHSWGQIPGELAQIIKDAGVHYFLFPSSEDTFKGLQRIINPFTVEDGLELKKYHAICVLNIGEKRMTPFMARMAPPPS
jgi:hypothetical protein